MNISIKLSVVVVGCLFVVLSACTDSRPLQTVTSSLKPELASTSVMIRPSLPIPQPAATILAPTISSPRFVSPTLLAAIPSPTAGPVPLNCPAPPNDYTRVTVNGHETNARTLWMLKIAAGLYHGRGSPLNVVQGSYVDDLAASFGTHAGGGAVDISVRVALTTSEILNDADKYDLVYALRQAGFAAWLRLPNDLNPPTSLHIHAIAIGDVELSAAARQQIDGPEGYLRGYDGVPLEHGGPHRDRYGGPLICDWMLKLGFTDLRQSTR